MVAAIGDVNSGLKAFAELLISFNLLTPDEVGAALSDVQQGKLRFRKKEACARASERWACLKTSLTLLFHGEPLAYKG